MHPLLILSLSTALTLVACAEPAQPTESLYRAVHTGDLDQVKRNLYWNADVNQPDVDGETPLHEAARTGRVAIAELLLSHGANPEALDASGRTPLKVALLFGKTQVARSLIEQGATLDAQAMLIDLVRQGVSDRDTFALLTRAGADVDRADAQSRTPLGIAVEGGYLGTVNRLLDLGADINRPDGRGRMPLAIALAQANGRDTDRQTIVEILKRNGARRELEPATTPNIENPEK